MASAGNICSLLAVLVVAHAGHDCQGNDCPATVNSLLQTGGRSAAVMLSNTSSAQASRCDDIPNASPCNCAGNTDGRTDGAHAGQDCVYADHTTKGPNCYPKSYVETTHADEFPGGVEACQAPSYNVFEMTNTLQATYCGGEAYGAAAAKSLYSSSICEDVAGGGPGYQIATRAQMQAWSEAGNTNSRTGLLKWGGYDNEDDFPSDGTGQTIVLFNPLRFWTLTGTGDPFVCSPSDKFVLCVLESQAAAACSSDDCDGGYGDATGTCQFKQGVGNWFSLSSSNAVAKCRNNAVAELVSMSGDTGTYTCCAATLPDAAAMTVVNPDESARTYSARVGSYSSMLGGDRTQHWILRGFNVEPHAWMKIDLGSTQSVTGVVSEDQMGRDFVLTFYVATCASSSSTCEDVTGPGGGKRIFFHSDVPCGYKVTGYDTTGTATTGVTSDTTNNPCAQTVRNAFESPISAQCVKFNPINHHNDMRIRFAVLVAPTM